MIELNRQLTVFETIDLVDIVMFKMPVYCLTYTNSITMIVLLNTIIYCFNSLMTSFEIRLSSFYRLLPN